MQNYINNPERLPNFLFLGSKGTGKTSLSFVLIKKIGADYIKLNASDESSIDIIRGKVKKFASTLSSKINVPKIVFLDEVDYLGGGTSKTAQAALRGIMEEYASNCRFILTANYQRKLLPEIQDRCVIVKFGNIDKIGILNHLKNICQKENKKFDDEGLKKLINIYYPSIRSMVNRIQVLEEITWYDIKKDEETANKIFELIKQKKIFDARKLWIEEGLDCRELLKDIFNIIIGSELKNKLKLIDLCGLYDYRLCISGDNDIQMTDFAVKLGGVLSATIS